MGITNDGSNTEERFCEITGWTQNGIKKNDSRGDARSGKRELDKDNFVELKKKTLNQVRPYKGIPIVSRDPDSGDWYVISPKDVLRMCLDRKGQHVLDPLCCVGLGVITAKKFAEYKVPERKLAETVERSIEDFDKELKLKRFLSQLKKGYERQRTDNQSQLKKALQ